MLIALGLVALAIAGFLAYVASRPDTVSYRRATLIKASPETVFGLINDLPNFNRWNPWARMDPNIVQTYRGPSAGVGAFYAWESRMIGSGSMEITESVPSSQVVVRLIFVKPVAATNRVDFIVTPKPEGVEVAWLMSGNAPFMSKLFGVFVNVEKMIAKDFDAGLAGLKAIAEA